MNSISLLATIAAAGLAGCAAPPTGTSGAAGESGSSAAPTGGEANRRAKPGDPIQPSPVTIPAEVQPPHRSPGDLVEPAPPAPPKKPGSGTPS